MTKPVCFITGTTHGIGTITARRIAERGYTTIMGCRDLERGRATRNALQSATGNSDIHAVECDLASLESVRRCAARVLRDFEHLSLLVNNAGMMTTRQQFSPEGIELTFAANYLGPWLLTNLLLNRLVSAERARIVNVASKVHLSGVISLEALTAAGADDSGYSGMAAYARSKLGNVMFTLSLAERLAGSNVTANCLHPGVVATNITAATNAFLRVGMKLAAPFMFNERRGAETSIFLALDPSIEGISGRYYDENQQPAEPAPTALDQTARSALWHWSESATGLTTDSADPMMSHD